MLENLHVKNLALIEEQEISFTEGLNILTGETGAGKSIVLGSIQLALGARADKESIRSGAEYALIELLFSLNELQREQVLAMELPVEEDGTLLLQRKLTPGKSICRVNGETISARELKELSGCLLDMYGQHEHQTLLKPLSYGRMLDQYIGTQAQDCKEQLKELLKVYHEQLEELEEQQLDEAARKREEDLLSFEIQEIEAAALKEGEDEQLEAQYRKLSHARKIQEAVNAAHDMTGYEEADSVGNVLARALRELGSVQSVDEEIRTLSEQLAEIESLLNDFNRSLSAYRESLDYEEEDFAAIGERLNVLNHIKSKYGSTIPSVLLSLDQKRERLARLADYECYRAQLQEAAAKQKQEILAVCKKLSELRRQNALPLGEKLKQAMVDLNFLDVQFEIRVEPDEEQFKADGYDHVEFMISVNPGEALRPVWQVASGGELSRIMLAIKTVFADKEDTATLIFDEIDTGISGRTAWKVSEKLGQLAKGRQLLCITHLPQIAAMADTHFLIEKKVSSDRTVTDIRKLSEEEALGELSRLLGSGEVTQATITNAEEMRKTAERVKAEK